MNAFNNYYKDIKFGSPPTGDQEKTRGSIFLEHTSLATVEINIIGQLYPNLSSDDLNNIRTSEESRNDFIESNINGVYPDTYRFLQSLWSQHPSQDLVK